MSRTLFRSLEPLLAPARVQFRPSASGPLRALQRRRYARSPADDPNFTSVLDRPPQLVRSGQRKHGPGILVLAAIPITAFILGTWQLRRLGWKTDMINKYEDRLIRAPLPLPPHVDTTQMEEFDYRRIVATGHYRHDQEMLIGPRVRDGENGYQIVTPLERPGDASTVLVARGWIAKDKKEHKTRVPEALPRGDVTVQGLLRAPWKKNMFTPDNRPETGEFYFPDVEGMAKLVGAQPVWIEETTDPDFIVAMGNRAGGIPIARAAEVNIQNSHMQYIVTWYGLSIATTVMFYLLVKRPPPNIAKRVRQSSEW